MFLYNFPECYWIFQKGSSWQQATGVAEERRKGLFQQLGLKNARLPDWYEEALLGTGDPEKISCSSRVAEGGGLCWFSTVYYLSVGIKNG